MNEISAAADQTSHAIAKTKEAAQLLAHSHLRM